MLRREKSMSRWKILCASGELKYRRVSRTLERFFLHDRTFGFRDSLEGWSWVPQYSNGQPWSMVISAGVMLAICGPNNLRNRSPQGPGQHFV